MQAQASPTKSTQTHVRPKGLVRQVEAADRLFLAEVYPRGRSQDCSLLYSLGNYLNSERPHDLGACRLGLGLSQVEGVGGTFLSQGCRSLIRPSPSHFTTAASSLVCSTVPTSPVGFPKLPRPSTRSPGLSCVSLAGGSVSRGLFALSASGAEPGWDKGGWGALRSAAFGSCVYGSF